MTDAQRKRFCGILTQGKTPPAGCHCPLGTLPERVLLALFEQSHPVLAEALRDMPKGTTVDAMLDFVEGELCP